MPAHAVAWCPPPDAASFRLIFPRRDLLVHRHRQLHRPRLEPGTCTLTGVHRPGEFLPQLTDQLRKLHRHLSLCFPR